MSAPEPGKDLLRQALLASAGDAPDDAPLDVQRLRRSIGLRLTTIARMLRSKFDRKVAGLHATRSQWAMIAVVANNAGATQRTIAEALDMTEASAGRLVDRLCADGLLERRERSDDRRARAVYLTSAAEPLLSKLAEIAALGEMQMLKGFTDDEIAQLGGYLDRIYDNVNR